MPPRRTLLPRTAAIRNPPGAGTPPWLARQPESMRPAGWTHPRRCHALPTSQHDRRNRESFWNLVQKDGQKDDPPQPAGNDETGGDGDAVEKSMDDQSDQHRVSPVTVDKCIPVRFLAKVKVRRNRMLEQ